MPAQIHIDQFLQKQHPLFIDVRSESEYEHAHIPGAINIPLLCNEERKQLGTIYKQKGREAAVKAGFELVGPKFSEKYSAFQQLAKEHSLLFYCWRGGLRSQISATILEWGGAPQNILKGGYKKFRNQVITGFKNSANLVVLSGMTGVGKTDILKLLQKKGAQILDLEGIAHHKGSALGSLGQPLQPSNEMFENTLYWQWMQFDFSQPIFVENESRRIGQIVLPADFWEKMHSATIIDIDLPFDIRLKRILSEYGQFDTDDLAQCTLRIQKRLGGLQLKHALAALSENKIDIWATILMNYYDRTYLHSRQEQKNAVDQIHWNWEQADNLCDNLLKKYSLNLA